MSDSYLMPCFWRCWRCGGQHPTSERRCPKASPNEDPPTRAEMKVRLNRFLMHYAVMCEAINDRRMVDLKREGIVPIAEAVRRESMP